MTVELLQEGLPRVLEQAGQAAADLPEKAAALVDSAVDAAEQLIEQPEVRVLAVNALLVVLLCLVGLLFYVSRRALAHAPYGSGLQSITFMILGCLFICFIEVGYRPPYLDQVDMQNHAFCGLHHHVSALQPQGAHAGHVSKAKTKASLLLALLAGVGVYALILGSFFCFRSHIDLSQIALSLTQDSSISEHNFLFVSLYISFFNSLLEEIFFRGFAFLSLRREVPQGIAACVSALAFSLYHFVIMASWFKLWIFVLLLVSLFVAGLFFNWVDSRSDNIYNSWLIHMFANFSINTVGFLMFGMV